MTDSVHEHQAITRRLYEYAYGIDTRDWELYRSIFADSVTADFSSYNGRPAATMTADDWVAGVKPLFTGLDATQHSMTNPLVDLTPDGGAARCRMYMQAVHVLHDWPEPEFTIGGYYDDRLVRTAAGWRVAGVTLVVTWRRGDPALMEVARDRGLEELRP